MAAYLGRSKAPYLAMYSDPRTAPDLERRTVFEWVQGLVYHWAIQKVLSMAACWGSLMAQYLAFHSDTLTAPDLGRWTGFCWD